MERQTKDIYTLAHSKQDHQIAGEMQLINLTESINFLLDKFEEYEEDRTKKDKIIEDLKSEVDSLSTKIEKLERETSRPARTIFMKKLSPSTWDCRRERRNDR